MCTSFDNVLITGIPLEERIDIIRLLVSLLGPPNIDTLYVLLKFLHEVSLHSHDHVHQHTGAEVRQCGQQLQAPALRTVLQASTFLTSKGIALSPIRCG